MLLLFVPEAGERDAATGVPALCQGGNRGRSPPCSSLLLATEVMERGPWNTSAETPRDLYVQHRFCLSHCDHLSCWHRAACRGGSTAVRGGLGRAVSQNHRIVGVGRDLCGSSSPTLLPKQGHLQQAAQDLVQPGLEYLQRRRLHSLPGQPVPGLRHPQREEVLPHVQTELPVPQFVPIAPCPGTSREMRGTACCICPPGFCTG